MEEYARLIPVSEWIGVGDLVTTRGGTKLFKVLKVNPKNLRLEDEEGKTYTLNRFSAVKAPEGSEFATAPRPATAEVWPGTVVTFTGDMAFRAPGKFVCIGLLGEGRAKFAALNGDGGRYWKVALVNVALSEAF
jgi:hypothetical protein